MNHTVTTYLQFKSRRAGVILSVLLLPSVLLMGCGNSKIETTTLNIDKDGKVRSTIVEEFGESYYDLQELSDMAAKEASVYNSEYINEKVFLESVTEDEKSKVVTMVMSFNSTSDYSHFNQVSLFYGTVQEALDKGYKVSDELVDKDGQSLGADALKDNLDKHIVITTDRSNIITPYNILYMTKGIQLKSKKEAQLADVSADTVQLLLAK